MTKHLKASKEAGQKFYEKFRTKGKITMLNLLKFKPLADYTEYKSIQPTSQITGRKAYELYLDATKPEIDKLGAKVLFAGDCENFLIGPNDEHWDFLLLVEHQSLEKFMAYANSEVYKNNVGHRYAALLDSRLLPTTKKI